MLKLDRNTEFAQTVDIIMEQVKKICILVIKLDKGLFFSS